MGRYKQQQIELEDFHSLDFDATEYDAAHAEENRDWWKHQDDEMEANDARQFEIDAQVFELQTIGWVD